MAIQSGDISYEGKQVIIEFSILVFFATLAVSVRFYSRLSTNTIGTDDWIVLVALFIQYGLFITEILWAKYGYAGFHELDLNENQLAVFIKYYAIVEVVYYFTAQTVKLSVLFLYRRIFVTRSFLWSTVIVGGIVVAWWFAAVFVWIFQCQPVGSLWQKPINLEGCIDLQKFYAATAVSAFTIDVILLIMPMFAIWNLQLSHKRKLGLSVIFLIGGFACISCLLRLVLNGYTNYTDLTLALTRQLLWVNVETCLGIICACMPTFPALFLRWFHSTKDWISKRPQKSIKDSQSTEATSIEKESRLKLKFGKEKTLQSRGFEESIMRSMTRILEGDMHKSQRGTRLDSVTENEDGTSMV